MLGCSPDVSTILTKITTYKGHLPQGAPTSTSLANVFIFSIDEPIRAACARLGVSYSVWVDDLNFSGDAATRIIPIAIGTLGSSGLKASRKKFKVAGPNKPKEVTGINLTGSKISVLPAYANRIRAGIHKLRTGQVPFEEFEDYITKIQGHIAYVRNIDPDRAKRFLRDLEIAKKKAQTSSVISSKSQ